MLPVGGGGQLTVMSHILEQNYLYSTHTYQFLLAHKTAKFISWVYILPFLEDNITVHTFWRLLLLKSEKNESFIFR
jgi:hypothetical protein